MSQSSVSEQVKDLESIGFPVHRGTRITARNPEENMDLSKMGSDIWLSRWSTNAFRNYPIVSRGPGCRMLCDAAKGLPAFVVGVGPSLDNSIKELKGLDRHAIIISTDAALRALLANGIRPHLVISYDCKDEQKLLWETVKDAPPCLFNSCAHPNSIASWPGKVIFFNQYHLQDDLCGKILPVVYQEIGQLPSAATVGTMAVFAAQLFGCDPICTVGMDFCYQPYMEAGPNNLAVKSWRYRAKDYRWKISEDAGVPDFWEPTEIKELYDNDERLSRSFMVKGDDGKEYKSDPELAHYLDSFKTLVAHWKIPIVNCSPEGMIPSSSRWILNERDSVDHTYLKMSVTEAVEKYCKAELQSGRTILFNLEQLLKDPRTA